MNRLTRTTLKALAPAGSQIAPVRVEQRRADDRQVEDGEEERDEQDDRRDEQRHEHGTGEDRGRTTAAGCRARKPPVTATTT